MKVSRKPGVTRRPVEYVLPLVAAAMIIILLLLLRAYDQANKTTNDNPKQPQPLVGSIVEVNRLTEEGLEAEEKIDIKYDELDKGASTADSAVDDLGGVYDETTY